MIAWPHPTFHHHIAVVYAANPLCMLRCSEVGGMLGTYSLSRRVVIGEWMKALRVHRERNKSDKWVCQEEKAMEFVGMLTEGWTEESAREQEYPDRWPLR